MNLFARFQAGEKLNARDLRALEADLKARGQSILSAADQAGRDLTAAEDAEVTAAEAALPKISAALANIEAAAARRAAFAGSEGVQVDARIAVGTDRAALDPRAGFQHYGEFMSAVRNVSTKSTVDDRLRHLAAAGNMREAGSDGYLVPPEYRDRIWAVVNNVDDIAAMTDEEPTESNHVIDQTDSSTPWGGNGIDVRWAGEAAAMTPSKPDPDTPRTIILHKLYAFVRVSDELLQDAPRLENRLTVKSGTAISWKRNDTIFHGNGVGKPLGFMNSGALVTVAKESGQAADTINAKNIAKMFARMLSGSVANAVFMANSEIMPQLLELNVSGQPVWIPNGNGFAGAPGGFLLGRPVKFVDHCKALGDLGDIVLADLKGYHGLRKANGLQSDRSMHLYFDSGETAFRYTLRQGGQPHLSAPVSPAYGAATKSHFVALAERA
jgi:HK97 family phage major capsid protein